MVIAKLHVVLVLVLILGVSCGNGRFDPSYSSLILTVEERARRRTVRGTNDGGMMVGGKQSTLASACPLSGP